MSSNEVALHSTPDFRFRAQLTEQMDEPCTRDEMRACLRDIARLNRWFLAYRPLLRWLDGFALARLPEPLRILDVGCGYGDVLRRVMNWAESRKINAELIGLDMNPDAVAIAGELTPPASWIRWVAGNVFEFEPQDQIHFVISSQFTHHLSEPEIVRFLRWMEHHATLGWFINDLSRAAIPYHFIRIFTRFVGLHRFVQSDAPTSIARSFVAQDWRRICATANLEEHDVVIHAQRPVRLCVGRRKLG